MQLWISAYFMSYLNFLCRLMLANLDSLLKVEKLFGVSLAKHFEIANPLSKE